MSAFQRELIRMVPYVRAYALIISARAADADDLTQDTLEKAWRARNQFEAGSSMKAWLFTILRNTQANQWRRSRREVEDPDGGHAAGLKCEAGQLWRVQFADVMDKLSSLDPETRQALLLVTAGLSYAEAATVCDCNLRTLQSRVRRARLRMAETSSPECAEAA